MKMAEVNFISFTLRRTSLTVLSDTAILLNAVVVVAAGPTTSVQGEYLMTLYVPIAEARDVDDTLLVVNHPDGWVEGPELKGKTIAARQQYV